MVPGVDTEFVPNGKTGHGKPAWPAKDRTTPAAVDARRTCIVVFLIAAMSVRPFSGGTGDPPVPSGDSPDGTERPFESVTMACLRRYSLCIPDRRVADRSGRVARATHFSGTVSGRSGLPLAISGLFLRLVL